LNREATQPTVSVPETRNVQDCHDPAKCSQGTMHRYGEPVTLILAGLSIVFRAAGAI